MNISAQIKEKQELAQSLLNDMVKLRDEGEGLKLAETRSAFDKLNEERTAIHNEIEALKRSALVDEYSNNQKEVSLRSTHSFIEKVTEKDLQNSWRAWLLSGTEHQRPEYIRSANKVGFNYSSSGWDTRGTSPLSAIADGSTQSALGGYTVQNERQTGDIVAMLKQFGGLRAHAHVITTSTAQDLPIPVADFTSEVAQIEGENDSLAVQDTAFQSKTLKSKKYSSDVVKLPFELVQDSAIDIIGHVNEVIASRLARKTESDYAIGAADGNQSAGILVDAAVGKVGAEGTTASATTYLELLDLYTSLDPAYRGNAKFMWHSSFEALIMQLLSTDGSPVWSQQMLLSGAPRQLFGNQCFINNSFNAVADNAKVAVFGDLSKYWIRDVGGVRFVRMNELYAGNDQIGLVAFLQTYGKLIRGSNDATCPVKSFAMENV